MSLKLLLMLQTFWYGKCAGALAFDIDYARWLDEHQRLINDLRSAVNSHMGDNDLRVLVDAVMSHYDEIFRLKGVGAKSDVFHMLSGMWKTPAERCFLWLGGFRSSELLKVIHLAPRSCGFEVLCFLYIYLFLHFSSFRFLGTISSL